MPRISEWLGSIMFLVALIVFVPNPRKALESIPNILAMNPKIVNGHLVMPTKVTEKQRTRKVEKNRRQSALKP